MADDPSEKITKTLTEPKDAIQIMITTVIETKEQITAYGGYDFGACMYKDELGFCDGITKADKLLSMAINGKRDDELTEIASQRGLANAKRMGVQEMQVQLAAEARR